MFKTIRYLRLFYLYMKDPEVSIWKKLLMVLPAIYFIMPIDILPDILFPFGYLDDAGVLIFAWQAITNELDKFKVAHEAKRANPKRPQDPEKVVDLNEDDYKVHDE